MDEAGNRQGGRRQDHREKLKVVPVLDKKWTGRYDVILASPQRVFAEGPRKVSRATTVGVAKQATTSGVDETVNVGFNTRTSRMSKYGRIGADRLGRHPGRDPLGLKTPRSASRSVVAGPSRFKAPDGKTGAVQIQFLEE